MNNKKQRRDTQNTENLTKGSSPSSPKGNASKSIRAASGMVLAGFFLLTSVSNTIQRGEANNTATINKTTILAEYRSGASTISSSRASIAPPLPAEEIKAASSMIPSLNSSVSNPAEIISIMNSTSLSSNEVTSLSDMIKRGAVNSGNGAPSYLSQPSYIQEIVQTAQECGSNLGVPWTFIFSLWTEETGYFTSDLAVYNLNFAGIKGPDNGWSDFNSINSFGTFFTGLLESQAYKGATNTGNFTQWINGLMNAHFDIGDTVSAYTDKVGSVMDFLFSNPNLKGLRRNVIILAAALGTMMLLSSPTTPFSISPYLFLLKNQLNHGKILSFIKAL